MIFCEAKFIKIYLGYLNKSGFLLRLFYTDDLTPIVALIYKYRVSADLIADVV